jgi:hypothetical protein
MNISKVQFSLFILVAFFTTLTKLHPKMKPYEYGFRVFLLTFCYVMVSGYNTGKFTDTATSRFILIAIGAAVSLGINVGIYPIWAGEDLHNLIAKNFTGVAKSLEGMTLHPAQNSEYFQCWKCYFFVSLVNWLSIIHASDLFISCQIYQTNDIKVLYARYGSLNICSRLC